MKVCMFILATLILGHMDIDAQQDSVYRALEEDDLRGSSPPSLSEKGEMEDLLSSTILEKIQLVEKLATTIHGLNDQLQSEVKGLKDHQANAKNELLGCVDEKTRALSNMASLEKELFQKKSTVKELRAELGLLQATSSTAAAKLKATSADVATESIITSLRSEIQQHVSKLLVHIDEKDSILSSITEEKIKLVEKLATMQGFNDHLQSKVKGLENRHADESTIASLRSDIEELRRENESLKVQLNGSCDINSKEQEVDTSPLPPTSSIIAFEDATTSMGWADIPNGYRRLNWENFGVIRRSQSRPGSLYEHGIVSGDYVAYNLYGDPCSISSTTPFSVAGFQATAATRMGLNVLVESFDDSENHIGVYITTLGDTHDGPTYIDLRREGDFEGLYKLKVTAFGGISDSLGSSGTHLAIDDLHVY